jgi:hypothetical protein
VSAFNIPGGRPSSKATSRMRRGVAVEEPEIHRGQATLPPCSHRYAEASQSRPVDCCQSRKV